MDGVENEESMWKHSPKKLGNASFAVFVGEFTKVTQKHIKSTKSLVGFMLFVYLCTK